MCCQPKSYTNTDFLGNWKTDSVYNYANGFGMPYNTPITEWGEYEYDGSGWVTERKHRQSRRLRYQVIERDSLVYQDSTGEFLSGYRIMRLNDQVLVLKKQKEPMLSGKNQTIFEMRFFSRTGLTDGVVR
ncbi:hypothetical protein [Xanthocytophaga agilis]|uniref:Lipocalin-like domain-containing protein n=1 Tax=Xanthocytophaga agilis TaxID=3048010 RepID=A0AAE3UIU0_9BACT|nr:hypothetical protein [Xanthocytophaga agilis]MDJ1505801.1 hypothetical protein [Xanthocytophaga agilis]